MSYFKRLGNATSQWLNALSGGNPDVPMSTRIAYYSDKGLLWYQVVEWIVDVAFFPLDGSGHCEQAYHSDQGETVTEGSVYSNAFLSLFSILGALIILPFTWGVYLLKKLI